MLMGGLTALVAMRPHAKTSVKNRKDDSNWRGLVKQIAGALVLSLIGATFGLAQSQALSKDGEAGENVGSAPEKMPPSLEIRFALSALPSSLREKAAVYVLDPTKGYILDHAGSNGQSCFVERIEWARAEYRNDIYIPMCYDSAGAKNQMQVRFDVAELRAQGLSPEDLKKEIEKRFADGTYKAPDRAGLSYMTAPIMRTYISFDLNDKRVMTMSMPHVMYYAPNVTDADVGGIPSMTPYPFVFEQGPQGFIIQRLGKYEAAKIVANESALLNDLCSYRSCLCWNANDSESSSHGHSK
jgi:hypothetical protein